MTVYENYIATAKTLNISLGSEKSCEAVITYRDAYVKQSIKAGLIAVGILVVGLIAVSAATE